MKKQKLLTAREAATYVLNPYSLKKNFTCEEHVYWVDKLAIKVIVKIFFNNKQKEANDTVRGDIFNKL